jgi:hypothetical protein
MSQHIAYYFLASGRPQADGFLPRTTALCDENGEINYAPHRKKVEGWTLIGHWPAGQRPAGAWDAAKAPCLEKT